MWAAACAPPNRSAEPVAAAAPPRVPGPATPDPDLFSIRPRAPGPARAARRKEATSQPQLANGALKVSVWSKVLRRNAAREDRDEILDVIYWSRQIISVGLGDIRGELPLRGFLGRAGLCLLSAGVLYPLLQQLPTDR